MSEGQEVIVGNWQAAPALPQAPQSTPAILVSLAIQQGANIEVLERLYNLQREYEKDEARKAYASAMSDFKAESIVIVKDKAVSHRGGSYRHATIGNVVNVLSEALGRHGLFHTWSTKQDGGFIHVQCKLMHRQGHSETVVMSAAPDDSGAKNAIQQFSSTVTYLERYSLLAVTGTATIDQADDDGGSGIGRDPRTNGFLASITAASTHDELRKVKVNITAASLPTADQQACEQAYAARLAELKPV